jgi:hypothetical protein
MRMSFREEDLRSIQIRIPVKQHQDGRCLSALEITTPNEIEPHNVEEIEELLDAMI